MLEQELGVIQQGPEQILGCPSAVLGMVGDFGDGQPGFGRAGVARQGRQEELVQENTQLKKVAGEKKQLWTI